VAILTDSPLPSNQSQTVLNLSAGTTSSTINYFPGGYYNVSAKYDGDGVFGSSTSPPVALKVSPENSTVTLSLSIGGKTIAAGGSVEYNYPFPLTLSIQPIGVSSITGKPNGVATPWQLDLTRRVQPTPETPALTRLRLRRSLSALRRASRS
jgi:hypothetical protein